MKRAQLIEWGIIVIALIFGYKFFESVISFFFQIIYAMDGKLIVPDMLKALLVVALYIISFIVLIRNSKRIAESISGPTDGSTTELIVKIGKRSMLQVILVSICVTTILSSLADILYAIFDVFKSGARKEGVFEDYSLFMPGQYQLTVKIIQVVLAIITIAASKKICELLVRKDEADELVFDSKPEN